MIKTILIAVAKCHYQHATIAKISDNPCARSFVLRCVNKNYQDVVLYPALPCSTQPCAAGFRGFADVVGMVGTFIEGADGKMRPALCGGHDIGRLRDTWMSSHNLVLIYFLNRFLQIRRRQGQAKGGQDNQGLRIPSGLLHLR